MLVDVEKCVTSVSVVVVDVVDTVEDAEEGVVGIEAEVSVEVGSEFLKIS